MSPSSARRSFIYRRTLVTQPPADSLARRAADAAGASPLKLIDLSVLPRWGLKGRDTFSWLAARGAATPGTDNTAQPQDDGSLIARLSPGEALILSSPAVGRSSLAAPLDELPPEGSGACYPVPRRDSHCWFVVPGADAPRMFAKVCAVDLAPDQFPDRNIAQTIVARLSAIVIRHDIGGSLAFSVLAESASAEYLWDCLVDAMAEFSGAVCSGEVLATMR